MTMTMTTTTMTVTMTMTMTMLVATMPMMTNDGDDDDVFFCLTQWPTDHPCVLAATSQGGGPQLSRNQQ
eukprot:11196140-Lingulodinium_polyedra.AAC.1